MESYPPDHTLAGKPVGRVKQSWPQRGFNEVKYYPPSHRKPNEFNGSGVVADITTKPWLLTPVLGTLKLPPLREQEIVVSVKNSSNIDKSTLPSAWTAEVRGRLRSGSTGDADIGEAQPRNGMASWDKAPRDDPKWELVVEPRSAGPRRSVADMMRELDESLSDGSRDSSPHRSVIPPKELVLTSGAATVLPPRSVADMMGELDESLSEGSRDSSPHRSAIPPKQVELPSGEATLLPAAGMVRELDESHSDGSENSTPYRLPHPGGSRIENNDVGNPVRRRVHWGDVA